jgi:hypothetical protein
LPNANWLLKAAVLRLIGNNGPGEASATGAEVTVPAVAASVLVAWEDCSETRVGVADDAEVFGVVDELAISSALDAVEELTAADAEVEGVVDPAVVVAVVFEANVPEG